MSLRENYSTLENTYIEKYLFISASVNGPIVDPDKGLRAGLPVRTLISGPVKDPSPLNDNGWAVDLPSVGIEGIL